VVMMIVMRIHGSRVSSAPPSRATNRLRRLRSLRERAVP
jgi:hypothetical protein